MQGVVKWSGTTEYETAPGDASTSSEGLTETPFVEGVRLMANSTSSSPSKSIPRQLHLSPDASSLTKALFPSPLRDMRGAKMVETVSRKPLSHLWTSDYQEDGWSAWAEYCRDNHLIIHPRRRVNRCWWHVLTPDPKARIIVVSTVDDYDRLTEQARVAPDAALPTRWISKRADALRVEEGVIRSLRDRGIDFDVPCMAWFRWAFTSSVCVYVPGTKAVL